ncbi:MAG: UPF0175 family protein [Candidatus Binatia bacterium]
MPCARSGFSIPDEALLSLKLTPEQMESELRLTAAIKLYELGKLCSGAAAALAGIPRALFLAKLEDYGVETFEMETEEIERETRLV